MKTLIVLVFAIVFKTALSRPGGFDGYGSFGDLFKDFNDDTAWKTTSFKDSPFSKFDMSSLLGSNMDLAELGEPVVKSKTFGPITKKDGPVTASYGGSVHTAQWGPKVFSSSGPSSCSNSSKPSPSYGNTSSPVSITKYPDDNMLSEKAKNNPSPWGKSGTGSSTPTYSKLYEPPVSQQKAQGLPSSPSPYASKAEPAKKPTTSNNSYSPSSNSYGTVKSGSSTPLSSPNKPSTSPPKAVALPQILDDDIVPISQILTANIPHIGAEVQVLINTEGLTAEEFKPFSQDVQQRMEEYFGVQVESEPMENIAPYN